MVNTLFQLRMSTLCMWQFLYACQLLSISSSFDSVLNHFHELFINYPHGRTQNRKELHDTPVISKKFNSWTKLGQANTMFVGQGDV